MLGWALALSLVALFALAAWRPRSAVASDRGVATRCVEVQAASR
jgi:hypothetical protein